jgi:hypothetical protein
MNASRFFMVSASVFTTPFIQVVLGAGFSQPGLTPPCGVPDPGGLLFSTLFVPGVAPGLIPPV